MAAFEFVWINGSLHLSAVASIGIEDAALNRGYGVFDFLKTKNGIPLFVENHIDRLFFSASSMHLNIGFSKQQLMDVVLQLLVANKQKNVGVKILVTGGYSDSGYSISKPNIIISCHELPAYPPSQYQEGIQVITHEYRREMPMVKTINYSRGLWLLPTIEAAGATDVIYISNGHVFETPRSNVYIVNNQGEVSTAKEGVLYGITRNNLIEAAKGKIAIKEEAVSTHNLRCASEVFITSTTKGILPITRIDGQPVGNGKPGPVAKELAVLLQQLETAYLQQHGNG